jgi:hypothetical protein
LYRHNRAEVPASQNWIQVLRYLEVLPLSERQLLGSRQQETLSRRSRHVAAVVCKILPAS